MTLIESWIQQANDPECPFPVNNLPCGVFSASGVSACCGVAIGDMVLNVSLLEEEGLIAPGKDKVLAAPSWNLFMELGPKAWTDFRHRLTELLREGGDNVLSSNKALQERALVPLADVVMHMPFKVAEYTDFYAGRHHATNVGTMFRGAENALPPNWLHMPIGYNGRASSVVVSGTDVRRPWGQLKSPAHDVPAFMPCRRFDLELEMGAVIGTSSSGPVSVAEADAMIFGYVLLNDWSARDIQAWEYQPLGPFQAKATATSISPWIIMSQALEPFRTSTPEREKDLLPYLHEPRPMLFDIDLAVDLVPGDGQVSTIARTNYAEMYYSAAQQLAHHTTSGCPMRCGDLIGSGTISGPDRANRGSMLEQSWGGKEPLTLGDGTQRSFLEDGDTITLRGEAVGDGYKIGFGKCTGKILPALKDPYSRD